MRMQSPKVLHVNLRAHIKSIKCLNEIEFNYRNVKTQRHDKKLPDLPNSHDDFSQRQGELPSLEDYFVE